MPLRTIVTEATRADCCFAEELIEAIPAQNLIADKGYDADALVDHAQAKGMQVHIPPRSNRLKKRDYDKHLYKLRLLVENAFAKIKQCRSLATRYAKRTASFHAMLTIAAILIWLKF